MIAGLPKPILVLAVGNLLLGDDAAGLKLAARLPTPAPPDVEVVDGGTQGIALLGLLEGRQALLILDAVSLGAKPGTIHVLQPDQFSLLRARRETSAHEGNALTLLELAQLLGTAPSNITIIGIEPKSIRTGIGLSPEVEAAMPAALAQIRRTLLQLAAREAVCV